jgi:biotin-dependent carboxylase-like uncharacterized protein
MGHLTILKPGVVTTVQDLGRRGHAALGVPLSGAADPLSLRIGNRLLGNADGAAALEMTLHGAELRFDSPARAVLVGADAGTVAGAGIAEKTVGAYRPIRASAGEVLRIGAAAMGARAYLCIRGGIQTAPILGSRSTHAVSGAGGIDGHAVQAGDVVPILDDPSPAPERSFPVEAMQWHANRTMRRSIRIVASSHTAAFAAAALEQFLAASHQVTQSSNRMGLRLAGPAIAPADRGGHMLTEPMPLGGIQITPEGQAILLLNDGPITGGYPLIAAVASIDLPACGQLRPGDTVRFELISLEASRQLLVESERALNHYLPQPAVHLP